MLSPEAQVDYLRADTVDGPAPASLMEAEDGQSISSRSQAPDGPEVTVLPTANPPRPRLGKRAQSAPLVQQVPLVQQALRNDTAKNQVHRVSANGGSRTSSLLDAIVDDPFFNRYIDPKTQLPKELFHLGLEKEDSNTVIAQRATSGNYTALLNTVAPQASKRLIEANIGVIRLRNVETSDFVSAALIPADLSLGSKSKTFTINGVEYTVRLFEFLFEDIIVREDGFVIWPQALYGMVPHIHGAMFVYDAQHATSLELAPRLTDALTKASIKSIVVCLDSATPQTASTLNSSNDIALGALNSEVRVLQSSPLLPGSEQRCVEVLLHAVAFGTSGPPLQSSLTRQNSIKAAVKRLESRNKRKEHSQVDLLHTSSHTLAGQHEFLSPTIIEKPEGLQQELPAYHLSASRQPPTLIIPESPENLSPFSSLELESDERRSSNTSQDTTIYDPAALLGKAPELDQLTLTFDELVDRFLTPPDAKTDMKFVATFLAFYRMFAAPFQLLDAITYRFDYMFDSQVDREANHPFLVRCLLLLHRWINSYPGDFAHAATTHRLGRFLDYVSQDRTYLSGASQMILALQCVVANDDTHWAYSDAQFAWRDSMTTTAMTDDQRAADSLHQGANTSSPTVTPDGNNVTVSLAAMEQSRPRRNTQSSSQQSLPKALIESSQRQAALLNPHPTQPFTKTQWHTFMAIPEETIARELTRIDWIMFTSIKPRDLIRHVTVPSSSRSHFPRLQNVTRMIAHFNHTATWIANIILLRVKPKHRALALEKCMRLARKIRELNNYNSLGAVIAGIHGSAIHRLQATRDLVNPAVCKDFLRLEMLMGTQKGSFAYRLAWENSGRERIPFLPLHRGDLAVSEASRETFAGVNTRRPSAPLCYLSSSTARSTPHTPLSAHSHISAQSAPTSFTPKINWRKFEAMGDVLVGIQRAQQMPYTGLTPNEDVRALLLDMILVTDEDELYEWSQNLEPSGSFSASDGGNGSAGRILKRSFERWVGGLRS